MEHHQKLYAAKTTSWPGATPFFPPLSGPNPLRGFGGHARPRCARSARAFGICRVREFKIVLATLPRLFVEHLPRLKSNFHAPTETT